jgi:predicted O-linked N-acetylglucosamine transferase (SPINDLY family)
MPNEIYQSAIEKIAHGTLQLRDLIEAAGALAATGQAGFARQLYQTWINRNPTDAQLYVALFNCSALEGPLGDTNAAIESLKRALALKPDFMPAYINLGGLMERSGGAPQAIALWRTAVARPVPVDGAAVNYAVTALKQIARVFCDHHQPENAEGSIRHCIDIDPHQRDIIEQYVAVRLAQCKWPIIVPWERADRRTLTKGIHPLSIAVFTDDPLLQLGSADHYARSSQGNFSPAPETDRRHAPVDFESRRLRVGYVSSDLRDHAIGYLMAEFFELHDRSKVEVFAYYCGPESKSPLQSRIKSAVEHWTDIRTMNDDEAARAVAADGIDILVDVNGHTRDAKPGLFARRAAPILVNWLGYPGTMGTPYHHYIIADDFIIPPESELYYSEKVVRLPCYQPNDRKRQVAASPSRAELSLPDDAFVYCCFNGTHKITRFTFDRWAEILKRVPGSVLWLLDTSAETKKRLGDLAEQKGIARARLVFAPKMANPQHLARYPLADLFLDTSPYGAHTTASDALWMGVPVLTLSGRGFASRVCGSLVRSAGLQDFVVSKPEAYVERAVALGKNRKDVEAARAKLRANRDTCQLFDTGLLVSRIEDLYRDMCRDHQQGRLPRPELKNLDAYFEAGADHDHDSEEVLAIADYHGTYKAKLARLHTGRPLVADGRLWTEAAIAAAEETPIREVAAVTAEHKKKTNEKNSSSPVKRRKTGTR